MPTHHHSLDSSLAQNSMNVLFLASPLAGGQPRGIQKLSRRPATPSAVPYHPVARVAMATLEPMYVPLFSPLTIRCESNTGSSGSPRFVGGVRVALCWAGLLQHAASCCRLRARRSWRLCRLRPVGALRRGQDQRSLGVPHVSDALSGVCPTPVAARKAGCISYFFWRLLVGHCSHDDVGWLKTVDQYFMGANNSIQHAGVQVNAPLLRVRPCQRAYVVVLLRGGVIAGEACPGGFRLNLLCVRRGCCCSSSWTRSSQC